jgi:hypothetical protein
MYPRTPRTHLRRIPPVVLLALTAAALWSGVPAGRTASPAAAKAAPSVRVTGPLNKESFQHLSDIEVTAEAADPNGDLSKVEFYHVSRGSVTLIGTDTTVPFDAAIHAAPGPNQYSIHAVAYDAEGSKTQSESVIVQVEYWPPISRLASPANGAWFPALSDITLAAEADARDGQITKVEFIQQSIGTVCAATSTPYSCVWEDVPAGTYTLFARTWDAAGNHLESQYVTAAVGEGQAALHNIGGRTTQAGGAPIAGATVTLTRYGLGLPTAVRTTTADADGDRLWHYSHTTGAAYEEAEAYNVQLDAHGNVYVLGDASPAGSLEEVVIKIDGAGGSLRWASYFSRTDGEPRRLGAAAMGLDAEGNAYVTGEVSYQGNQHVDTFTVKLGSADGAEQWMRVYAEPSAGLRWNADCNIAVDAAGNSYVYFTSMREWDDDCALVKYYPDGMRAWVYLFDNPYHSGDSTTDWNGVGQSIALDAEGNIYFTGYSFIPGHSTRRRDTPRC